MKSLAALLNRKAIDSSVETNRSTLPLASPGAGSVPDAERAASVRPSGSARKTRLGALSGLVDRFSSLRRERNAARSGAGGSDPAVVRQLEQRLRHHPELKPARLAQYRAELGLDGAEGIGALTANNLARMPPKLAGQIAAIRHAGVVGPRTIDAVWDALETNMELYESPLRAVGTAAARPVAPTTRHTDLHDGRRVIATSTPAAVEVAAFHRTLVQEKIALVVDLTRGARSERHVPYAPAKAETVQRATGSTIDVTCKSRGKLPPLGVVQQQLRVHDVAAPVTADTFATSTVTRLHFKGWPAHGPIDGKTLATLADLVESCSPDRSRPTLIHCPDGSGRSDTLMTFMAARKRIADATSASVGGAANSASGGNCSVALIMSTLADVVARGRLESGPSFLANRDDFAVIASTLVQQFEPAIRQSSRVMQTSAQRPADAAAASHA